MILSALALLSSISLVSLSVDVQAPLTRACHNSAEMSSFLARTYKEFPRIIGVGNDGQVEITYMNEEQTSWTRVIIMPEGLSCVIAMGTEIQIHPKQKTVKGDSL